MRTAVTSAIFISAANADYENCGTDGRTKVATQCSEISAADIASNGCGSYYEVNINGTPLPCEVVPTPHAFGIQMCKMLLDGTLAEAMGLSGMFGGEGSSETQNKMEQALKMELVSKMYAQKYSEDYWGGEFDLWEACESLTETHKCDEAVEIDGNGSIDDLSLHFGEDCDKVTVAPPPAKCKRLTECWWSDASQEVSHCHDVDVPISDDCSEYFMTRHGVKFMCDTPLFDPVQRATERVFCKHYQHRRMEVAGELIAPQ